MNIFKVLFNIYTNDSLIYSEIDKLIINSSFGSKKYKITNKLPLLFFISPEKNLVIGYSVCAFNKLKNNYLFFSFLQKFYYSILFSFICRFRVIGRGYKVFGNTNHFLFKLGYSHIIHFTLPITYKIFKKEKIIHFWKMNSIYKQEISNLLYKIYILRYPNTYSRKGIFLQDRFILFKEGKKNFTL